jgi:hypothetical protein
MNENKPPDEDGPPNNCPRQTLGEETDGEQLQIPIPPADGMSLGQWIEWMPKDTQYRSHWMVWR